jgi:hypothetical protein
MAVVEYTAMRGLGIAVGLALLVAGCVTPVVLENPATSERVNCTVEAERLAYATQEPGPGTDVPRKRPAPTLTAFDLEQQCAGSLINEGFVCLSGCRDVAR